MARDTRRLAWRDVKPNMIVLEEGESPQVVDETWGGSPNRVHVKFVGDKQEYSFPEGDAVAVVTESGSLEPVVFREDAYLGTERSLTTLATFLKLAQLGYMRDDSSVAFFKPQIQREWNNLSQLMKDAGF